jgi:DNA-binding LytR/AlgR family response regulator
MKKCVIIDDEQPARELLSLHLSFLEEFELAASFDNAIEGFNFLQKNPVDLLFLDIEMPGFSGLELVRSLTVLPQIILTTAYREYAFEAFELNILDYLLKPITRDRFLKAISKFNALKIPGPAAASLNSFETAYMFLKTGTEQIKVYFKDIIYIEGLKDFTKVHTVAHVYIASERLSYMEAKLPESKFARAHKSYVISLEKIEAVGSNEIKIGGLHLPIGRVFKNEFLKKLSRGQHGQGEDNGNNDGNA